ncbi:MAG: hypothetical protein U0903_19405 [Planctomycetales bacterium]
MAQKFTELVESRKEWIAQVLIPWCRQAERKELRLAELDWPDIAGKIAPEKSLWFWAWGRFPELVHAELQGIDEASTLEVTMRDGTTFRGHPDARESTHGELVLVARGQMHGPLSIDDIQAIKRL